VDVGSRSQGTKGICQQISLTLRSCDSSHPYADPGRGGPSTMTTTTAPITLTSDRSTDRLSSTVRCASDATYQGRSGFTLWLTGLSGAGKSALARALRDALMDRGRRVEILDGDEVRQSLSKDLGFSKCDRDENVRRIGFVAKLLSRNDTVAIVAAISPFRRAREDLKTEHDAPFIEIFVDCNFVELIRRDCKGLYAKALAGELKDFTGVSAVYEPPLKPDVHLDTALESINESVQHILDTLVVRGLIAKGGLPVGLE
jgi:adenylylsulfate kinase